MNDTIFAPVAQGLKFTPLNYHDTCGNVPELIAPHIRSEDNTLMREFIAASQHPDVKLFEGVTFQREAGLVYRKCDTLPVQIKSNINNLTSTHEIEVYDNCDNSLLDTITLNLEKDNQNFSIRYDCKQLGEAGWMYVYFESGRIMNTSGLEIDKHYLNGNMPDFAEDVSNITIGSASGNNGTYAVVDIVYVESVNAFAFKVENSSFDAGGADGFCQMTYQRDEFDVYQANIPLADYNEKTIRLKVIGENLAVGSEVELIMYSEPIIVRETLPGYARFSWYNENDEEKFDCDFSNFRPFAYFAFKDWAISPDEIEDEQYKTDTGRTISVNTVFSEVYEFDAPMQMRWVVRLMDLIFKLDHVYIRGFRYQKVGSIEAEPESVSDRFNVSGTISKYNRNGVYEREWDFDHQDAINHYLKIDDDDNLKIDSTNKLRIS